MQAKLGRRIERQLTLIHHVATDTWTVETRKPFGRRWMWRKYKPTAASLRRLRRVVVSSPNGWQMENGRIVTWHYDAWMD